MSGDSGRASASLRLRLRLGLGAGAGASRRRRGDPERSGAGEGERQGFVGEEDQHVQTVMFQAAGAAWGSGGRAGSVG